MLSVRIYYDVSKYKDGTYKEILIVFHLDYTIYVNLKSEDLKNFEKFTNFLSRNNKC